MLPEVLYRANIQIRNNCPVCFKLYELIFFICTGFFCTDKAHCDKYDSYAKKINWNNCYCHKTIPPYNFSPLCVIFQIRKIIPQRIKPITYWVRISWTTQSIWFTSFILPYWLKSDLLLFSSMQFYQEGSNEEQYQVPEKIPLLHISSFPRYCLLLSGAAVPLAGKSRYSWWHRI